MAESFTPTESMRTEAQRGLDWRTEHGRGGTAVGIARARDIAGGKDLPLDTVRRMRSFFARHKVDKNAEGFSPGEPGYPSNGRIAWALWGGDPGQSWADRIVAAADKNRSAMRNGLTLPDAVFERLTVEQRRSILTDAPGPGKRGLVPVERRTRPMELRTDSGGDPHLVGYAMTWGVPYEVAGGPDAGGFVEIIERGAADKSLAERADVRFLADHEGLVLARTSSSTLKLSTDDVGLLSDASLDPSSPYAQSVISAVRRGDMSQMSHSMRVMRQSWSNDYTERRIQEIAMFDTSVVGFPANPVTAIALDQRALDPVAEAAEDTIVAQIKVLLAELIAGEAAEMADGNPATMSLSQLVAIARDLDCWEELDEYEDSLGSVEEDDEADLMVGRSMSLATARALADAVLLGRK